MEIGEFSGYYTEFSGYCSVAYDYFLFRHGASFKIFYCNVTSFSYNNENPGCRPRMLSHVISIPFIALHSIHTVLQLKPPQSPMLPCCRNISFPANSDPLKCRKFHFLADTTYSTSKPVINGHLYKMATTMICNANIECTFAVVACNGHLHTITNTNTSLSKHHKTST